LTREPNFEELVGEDVPAEERARLRRAHDLLVAAGPVPELPPSLEEPSFGAERERQRQHEGAFQLLPRRRVGAALALAAAIALIAFVGGYVAGFQRDGFSAQYSVAMHSVAGGAATADIKIGTRDSHGNLPLRLEVRNLPALKRGYYEMYLTHGDTRWTCGTFAGGGRSNVKVRLSVPYQLGNGDGWIVVKHVLGRPGPAPTVLTT
jgi:hypothetical protein